MHNLPLITAAGALLKAADAAKKGAPSGKIGTRRRQVCRIRMEKPLDGIWIIDVEGKTVFAGARMAEILRTSVAEMIGQDSFDYVYPQDLPAAQRLFGAKQRGDAKPFHFKLRRKDGSDVWVDVQGTPLHNAAGVFNGIVGTFTVA